MMVYYDCYKGIICGARAQSKRVYEESLKIDKKIEALFGDQV